MPFDEWDGHIQALHERLEHFRKAPNMIRAHMLAETVADFLSAELQSGYAGDENDGEPDTTTR
jgi:hypothetical protein